MKLIILAAGKGNRLRPLTDNIPKCMVKFNNIPIIDYLISTSKKFDFEKIIIVTGYKHHVLENHFKSNSIIEFCHNKNFNKTNMVYSFLCAKHHFNDDIIVSYSDIIFNEKILNKVIKSKKKLGVVVDNEWRKLWSIRMENPLDDAETLKILDNQIVEIGKKTVDYDNIHSQYIGLIKFSKSAVTEFLEFYKSIDRNTKYRGESLKSMYFTTLIQLLIDNRFKVSPIYINGGWIEIDSISDLENYKLNKISFDYSKN